MQYVRVLPPHPLDIATLQNDVTAPAAELACQIRFCEKLTDHLGHTNDVAHVGEKATLAMTNQVGYPANPRRHNWQSGCHRLDDRVGKAFEMTWEQEDVAIA